MMTQQQEALTTSHSPPLPYLKTIHHSSNILSVSPLKIFQNNEQTPYLLFAKTSSLDFYHFKSSTPIFSHSIDLYSKITALLVIPTRHKLSDSIFVADNDKRFTIYRPKENKQLDILMRKTFEFQPTNPETEEKINYGIQHYFNSNDTEGYIYYSLNTEMAIFKFAEKVDGFHEVSFVTGEIPRNSTIVTNIPKSKSRYKQETIVVCYYMSKGTHLEIYDLEFNEYNTNLKKLKLSPVAITIFAGNEFVVADVGEIQLFSYDFGEIIQTFRQPNLSSIKRIVGLTNTYCGIGDHLIIFNKAGMNGYGSLVATDGRHVGNNRIVTWHKYQNTKLIQLKDNETELIQEWVNLGPIEEIDVVDTDGGESYIVKSPSVKAKPISVVSNAIGFHEIAKEELAGGLLIKELFLVKDEDERVFVLVSSYFGPSRIFRVSNTHKARNFSEGKENILDQIEFEGGDTIKEPLLTYNQYIVTRQGIYKFTNNSSIIPSHLFEQQISKASISTTGILAVEIDQKTIQYFNINNYSKIKQIKVEKELSALVIYSTQEELEFATVAYCFWGSRKLHVVTGSAETKIKILREARSLHINSNNLFIGYSQGHIEIYETESYTKLSFACGATPVTKILQFSNKVYCFSDKSCQLSAYSTNCFSKKNLVLDCTSSFVNLSPLSTHLNIIASSSHNILKILIVDLSTNVHIKQLDISISSSYDTKMITISPYIYFFTPFRIHRYEIDHPQPQTEFHHNLSSITSRIQRWRQEYLLVTGKLSVKNAIVLMKREKEEAVLEMNNEPLAVKAFGEDNVVICSENYVKFIKIWEKQQKHFMVDGAMFEFEEGYGKSIDVTPYAVDVLPEHNKLVIGDTVRSLLLCSYNLEKEKLNVLSKFSLGNLSLEVSFLGNYILESDNSGNLFVVSGNLGSNNQLERTVLSFNGGLQLNESIWVMSKVHQSKPTSKSELIYGTSSGSIGRISLLPSPPSKILKTLLFNLQQLSHTQSFKSSQQSGLCSSNIISTILHKKYQNLKSLQRNKLSMKGNSLLNGDLIEYIAKTKQVEETLGKLERERGTDGEDQHLARELESVRKLIHDLDL